MPLYEYKCSKCGELFEVRQNFSDAPLSRHESCGGPVEKVLSAPALQFKGSGWYITDYARGGSNGKKDSKTESKTESKGDAGSSTSGSSSGSSSTAETK